MKDFSKEFVAELLAVIASVDAGRTLIGVIGETWSEAYCGNVTFKTTGGEFPGWTFIWFDDCNSWDYLERAIAPDGREIGFEDSTSIDEESGPRVPEIYDLREPANCDRWEAARPITLTGRERA